MSLSLSLRVNGSDAVPEDDVVGDEYAPLRDPVFIYDGNAGAVAADVRIQRARAAGPSVSQKHATTYSLDVFKAQLR